METNSKPWWDESIHWGLCGYSFLKTPRSLWLLAAIILIVWNWSMEWAYEQRERVKDITGYLKFCDEEVNKPQSRDGQDQPSPDKLYKLRRFLGKLLPKYDQEWVSHQWLTTDEQMIPFRGRVGFQQFEKNNLPDLESKSVQWLKEAMAAFSGNKFTQGKRGNVVVPDLPANYQDKN